MAASARLARFFTCAPHIHEGRGKRPLARLLTALGLGALLSGCSLFARPEGPPAPLPGPAISASAWSAHLAGLEDEAQTLADVRPVLVLDSDRLALDAALDHRAATPDASRLKAVFADVAGRGGMAPDETGAGILAGHMAAGRAIALDFAQRLDRADAPCVIVPPAADSDGRGLYEAGARAEPGLPGPALRRFQELALAARCALPDLTDGQFNAPDPDTRLVAAWRLNATAEVFAALTLAAEGRADAPARAADLAALASAELGPAAATLQFAGMPRYRGALGWTVPALLAAQAFIDGADRSDLDRAGPRALLSLAREIADGAALDAGEIAALTEFLEGFGRRDALPYGARPADPLLSAYVAGAEAARARLPRPAAQPPLPEAERRAIAHDLRVALEDALYASGQTRDALAALLAQARDPRRAALMDGKGDRPRLLAELAAYATMAENAALLVAEPHRPPAPRKFGPGPN